jgi:hypothetical protein
MNQPNFSRVLKTLIRNERNERKKGYLGGLIFAVVLVFAGIIIPFNGAALSMGIGFGIATIVLALQDMTQMSNDERNIS